MDSRTLTLFAFPSELGWIGLAHNGDAVRRCVFGHGCVEEVHQHLAKLLTEESLPTAITADCMDPSSFEAFRSVISSLMAENRFHGVDGIETTLTGDVSRIAHLLQKYAAGQPVDLSSIPVEHRRITEFQRRVLDVCRSIPYGETLTYGQVAAAAGSPRAARAVGTVMRQNRFPLIIPCHRVVSSNGIGGYSARDGVDTKRRLLVLEGVLKDPR